jgi:hypothetical protein
MRWLLVSSVLVAGSLGVLSGALTWGARCSVPNAAAAVLTMAAVGVLTGGALFAWAGRHSGGGGVVAAVVLAVAVAFLGLFALFFVVATSCAD